MLKSHSIRYEAGLAAKVPGPIFAMRLGTRRPVRCCPARQRRCPLLGPCASRVIAEADVALDGPVELPRGLVAHCWVVDMLSSPGGLSLVMLSSPGGLLLVVGSVKTEIEFRDS